MSGPKISVLGGSSPFTIGLINAMLPVGESLGQSTLMLHGRSVENLALVANHARHRLEAVGWQIGESTSLSEALDGADIVVHQIRYGDLVGRADGERLCRELGLAADETLGPAALLTAIRTMPALKCTAKAITANCPAARVLNLTNPLSAVTWALSQFGVANCVGLCELPLVTQQTAVSKMGLEPADVNWTYSGLNHRGFIDSLTYGERDLLSELPSKMRLDTIGGITAAEIEDLNAIPLKYFKLVRELPKLEFGRAEALSQLRKQIQSELSTSCKTTPPSIAERYMDWYPKSVVPLLVALCQRGHSAQMLNIQSPNGLVLEVAATVSVHGWEPAFRVSPNSKVRNWNERFELHERCFLDAMLDPTADHLRAVFESDPIMPKEKIYPATYAIEQICRNEATYEC